MRSNAGLILWSDGWLEELNQSSIDSSYRVEVCIGLGAQQDESEARKQGRSELQRLGQPREQLQVGIDPPTLADQPYRRVQPADRVLVQGEPWPVEAMRVRMVEGRPTFTPRMGDRIPSETERVRTLTGKLTLGGIGGDSRIATPAMMVSQAALKAPEPHGCGCAGFRAESSDVLVGGIITDELVLENTTSRYAQIRWENLESLGGAWEIGGSSHTDAYVHGGPLGVYTVSTHVYLSDGEGDDTVQVKLNGPSFGQTAVFPPGWPLNGQMSGSGVLAHSLDWAQLFFTELWVLAPAPVTRTLQFEYAEMVAVRHCDCTQLNKSST